VVHLASGRLRFERLAKHSVHFRFFLALQILDRAEVEVIGDWIRFHQNLLHCVNPDPAFYQ
jgi:hypothetical protein